MNLKKCVVPGIIVGSIAIVSLVSLYPKNKEVILDNKDIENNNLVAVYIKDSEGNYNKSNAIPKSGYTLNTDKSTCSNEAIPTWTKDNKLKINNLTKENTSCYLYFDEKAPSASETIIGNVTVKPGTDSFTSGATTAEDSGLFSTQDDDGTTYYYRGIIDNNWVDFADLKWRIIRINGDGSIRMIYNGTTTEKTGEGTQIGTSAFNTNYTDNADVGYMYGSRGASTYEATHKNTNNSTIKGVLDNWYKTNIVDRNYDSYVSKEAGFCGDREVQNIGGGYTENGSGTSTTSYAPFARLYSGSSYKTTQTPTHSCNINDLYTVSTSSKVNKALTYPVGLITSDEVIYAGGFGGRANQQYWLYTNQYYWTMSPSGCGDATVFFVYNNGNLRYDSIVYDTNGVRPVINLLASVQLTGSGTTSDPYRVEGA